jgi:hypothetical protein
MRQPLTDAAAIAVEVARIHALAPDGLRRTWRAVFGRTPPASLSTGLLARMIAWHIQERAFGGLDRDTCHSRKSYPRVSMVQAAQDGRGNDGPRSFDGSS